MPNNNKWGKAYWADLAERVGSSAVGGALTVFTASGTTSIHITTAVVETLILVPAAVSLLKGLLVNLGGDQPTASVVNVTST